MNRTWHLLAALGAVAALAAAGLIASLAPESECNAPQQVQLWPAVPPFVLFLALGTYVVTTASRAARLTLFLGTSLVIAGYVIGLALSLPMICR